MKTEQGLFRQQVIDELNSKLNGEILLRPGISLAHFLLCAVIWLALMATVYHVIEIDSSKIITGDLVLQAENNLVARFMLPIDFSSQINAGDIIPIQLLGISETQHLSTSIQISHIDRTLSVLGASYLGDSRAANLKVEAVLIDSFVLVQNQRFSLSEGITFSFSLNSQPQRLLPWLRTYFARGA
jgi:hypothetical protein